MDTDSVDENTRLALQAILASQIISLPVSAALTILVVTHTYKYLLRTSSSKHLPFVQPKGTARTKRFLARFGASVSATVCMAMILMELAVVYQSAVLHPGDLAYLTSVPWPIAMIPFLAGVIGIFALSFWADRTCRVFPYPRVAMAVIGVLVLLSLVAGFGATVSLFVEPNYDYGVSEGFFWGFLISWSVAGLFICLPLLKSWNSERIQGHHSLKPPTVTRTTLRLLLSTFLLPWLTTVACLSAAFASTSSSLGVSLRAGAIFMALQKILVRLVALAYIFTLLDTIPEVANLAQMQAYGMEAFDFAGQHKGSRTSRQRFLGASNLREVAAEAISSYETRKETDKTEGVSILAYAYPPAKEEGTIKMSKAVMAMEGDDITSARGHQSEAEEVSLKPPEPATSIPPKSKPSRRKDRSRKRISMMMPRSSPPPLEALPQLPTSFSQKGVQETLSLNMASLRPSDSQKYKQHYTANSTKSSPTTLSSIGHDGKGVYMPPFSTAEHDEDLEASSVAAWRSSR